MRYDPTKHHRRSIRLPDHDYTSEAVYFVTICVSGHACVLGKVRDNKVLLTTYGHVVAESWLWLATQYLYVTLDRWVIMPNHLHGIMILQNTGTMSASTTDPLRSKTLGRLLGAFKTVSTKQINVLRNTLGLSFWQRGYWEHIIRGENDLNRIRSYIETNPIRWTEKRLH